MRRRQTFSTRPDTIYRAKKTEKKREKRKPMAKVGHDKHAIQSGKTVIMKGTKVHNPRALLLSLLKFVF